MEKTIRICLGCQQPLPPDAPAGLCPACLLKTDVLTPGAPASATAPAAPGGHRRLPGPGQEFGGYRIIRLLGKGGMGEVYEAEQHATGRRVALKVMGHSLDSEADRKRFLREGRLAASVNHPNVVYVHGSEEVGEVPVIAMELVAGGTLKDRLKLHGPLPVLDAVEAMLQVIAGLEAAQHAGVLHRDIKPSNCFMDTDGTVKIGDFGLSVSTLARGESLLTATGAVLGTPAYASPEQLRGEELDMASDIYSVGATLYHLLTGQLPFQAADFVKLITEVLDKQPPAPTTLRRDIPDELSRILLRCLAKERKARFANYRALRDALLPFSRAEAQPARPGPRMAAGLVDTLIASLPFHAYELYWSQSPLDELLGDRTAAAALRWLPFFLWYLGYFTICEGRWGAGLGKALLGLRVMGRNRDVPGFPRAAGRTLLFMAPELVAAALAFAFFSGGEFRLARAQGGLGWYDWTGLGLFVVLFATMWRRFGYVAVLDCLSGTRVIVRQKTEARPALPTAKHRAEAGQAAASASLPAASFGPYQVVEVLWQRGAESLLAGLDPALRRKVWIHVRPAEAAPSSPARRDLSRPARLRWLGGGRHDSAQWDAYDAVEGRALTDLAAKPQAWNAVRFWLLDLARELSALLGEFDPPPVLALDRLWISQAGHALLLDFPAPAQTVQPADQAAHELDGVGALQKFLDRVARRAMEEPAVANLPPDDTGARAPAPIHARSFLQSLARGGFERAEFVIGNLESLANRTVRISRAQRFWSLALAPTVVTVVVLIVAIAIGLEQMHWQRAWSTYYPGKPSLRAAFTAYQEALSSQQNGGQSAEEVEITRAYLVKHFGGMITNENFWAKKELTDIFTEPERTLMRQAVTAHLPPSEKALQQAEEQMPGQIQSHEQLARFGPFFILLGFLMVCPWFWALIELASALVAGKARMVDFLGMAIVDRSGRPAGRLRLAWRWLVVWSPLLLLTLLGLSYEHFARVVEELFPFIGQPTINPAAGFLILIALIILGLGMLGAAVYVIVRPERGLQDRLAGTVVVVK